MAQKILPADPIGIVEGAGGNDLFPAGTIVDAKVDRDAEMRGARSLRVALCPAAMQAGDGRRLAAVNLKREQVVAAYARGPGIEQGAAGAARKLDKRRRRVLDVDGVARAVLVDPLWRRGRSRGDDA